ncbi:MAG: hypothetical protein WCH43_04550 [Verrucomicrobiota bacterium]
MKQIPTAFKLILTVAILALATACSTTPTRENTLVAAGFKIVVPKTPGQQQKLQALPTGKLSLVMKAGKTYYVYPDAAHNQAYVGGVQQYNYYKVLRSQQKMANQNLMEAQENQPIASDLDWSSDASWAGNGW